MFCSSLVISIFLFFFFKQKTAYEMRISDWSSDVCSSDLHHHSPDCRFVRLSARNAAHERIRAEAQRSQRDLVHAETRRRGEERDRRLLRPYSPLFCGLCASARISSLRVSASPREQISHVAPRAHQRVKIGRAHV